MTDDPFIYGTKVYERWPPLLLPYRNKRVIVVGFENEWIHCGFVGSSGHIESDCFYHARGDLMSEFKGREMKMEQWLDKMSVEFPDHFEWLLFHPELL